MATLYCNSVYFPASRKHIIFCNTYGLVPLLLFPVGKYYFLPDLSNGLRKVSLFLNILLRLQRISAEEIFSRFLSSLVDVFFFKFCKQSL